MAAVDLATYLSILAVLFAVGFLGALAVVAAHFFKRMTRPV